MSVCLGRIGCRCPHPGWPRRAPLPGVVGYICSLNHRVFEPDCLLGETTDAVEAQNLSVEVALNLGPGACDADANLAAVRLQERVEQLLSNYDELRSLVADDADMRCRCL